jgi:hypothetical protein
MDKQRAIHEIEKKKLQESQDILKKRADDIKVTSQKRVQELVAAHSKASDHHILRNVGRVVGGVLGSTKIIVTGGYAAPVVLGAVGVVETTYDEQEAKDKKIIANLQAALKD